MSLCRRWCRSRYGCGCRSWPVCKRAGAAERIVVRMRREQHDGFAAQVFQAGRFLRQGESHEAKIAKVGIRILIAVRMGSITPAVPNVQAASKRETVNQMSGTRLPYPLVRPIGIFDSGVGGLTVLKALAPQTAASRFHLPGRYRARPLRPQARRHGRRVRLRHHGISAARLGVEGVVIACNTASASALPELAATFFDSHLGRDRARRGSRRPPHAQRTCRRDRHQGHHRQRRVPAAPRTARTDRVGARLPHAGAHRGGGPGRIRRSATCCCTITWTSAPPLTRSSWDAHTIRCCTMPSSAWWAIRSRWWIAPKRWRRRSTEAWARTRRAVLQGRIVHFVTGDPLAFAHTSEVIGEVAGEVVPLPVTELIRLQCRARCARRCQPARGGDGASAPVPSCAPDR